MGVKLRLLKDGATKAFENIPYVKVAAKGHGIGIGPLTFSELPTGIRSHNLMSY